MHAALQHHKDSKRCACVARHLSPADLEQLHPDTGEHELQQRGDDHDVSDSSDCDKNALHHVL